MSEPGARVGPAGPVRLSPRGGGCISGCHFGSSPGLSFGSFDFPPLSLPMATFESIYSRSEFEVNLYLFLGLDHVARSCLRVAWKGYDRLLDADTPSFVVSDGRGGSVVEKYSAFRRRAFARECVARADAREWAPPPDERGMYVFVGWSLEGRRWPVPVPLDAVPGGVVRSNHRDAPFATAISDPRYWRGDQYFFWHRARFPESRAWPRVERPLGTLNRVPLWYQPWTHGPLPGPRTAGQRGRPEYPPDPRQ